MVLKSDSESGIGISPELECLRPVLRRWIKLNRELPGRWSRDGDVPWWYRERAVLSTFAGAIWLMKGSVLEEYGSTKESRLQKDRHAYSGRVDLFFTIGEVWFIAEAKQRFIPGLPVKKHRPMIKECIKQAKEAIGRSRPEGMRRLALGFVTPYFPVGHKSGLKSDLSLLVDSTSRLGVDAVAWVFPGIKNVPKSKSGVYPGIILLIKEVKRRTK